MADLRLTIEGLPEMVRKFSGSEEILTRHFSKAIAKAAILLQAQARVEAPIHDGQLRQRIVLGPILGLKGSVQAQAPYSFWVHEGRRPGKMPPIAPLEKWAVDHGMPGAGFLIARKIAQRGTKPNPFFTRAKERVDSQLPPIWKQAANEAVNELATK